MNLILLTQEHLRAGGGLTCRKYSGVSAGIKCECKVFQHFCIMLKMLGLAVASFGALVYAGYHTMAPMSQVYGRTFTGTGAGQRHMALTFDDGPNDPYTLQLLEVLSRYNVKATFFLIGKYIDQRPDIVRELVASGHVIANHTYTHPNLIFQSQSQFRDELSRCERALDNAVGQNHAPLFRPP